MERTDAYLDALMDIQNSIKKNKVDMTNYQVETIFGEKGMAFSKSEKLVEIYDNRIMELSESGELERIFDKWNYPFPADVWSK